MVMLLCEFDGLGMKQGCTIGHLRGSLLCRCIVLPCSVALDSLVRVSELEKRDFEFCFFLAAVDF